MSDRTDWQVEATSEQVFVGPVIGHYDAYEGGGPRVSRVCELYPRKGAGSLDDAWFIANAARKIAALEQERAEALSAKEGWYNTTVALRTSNRALEQERDSYVKALKEIATMDFREDNGFAIAIAKSGLREGGDDE